METQQPSSIVSAPFRRASIAIYTTVALAAFEGTAVAAVLPQVAGELGQLELLPWVVTAYLFASGVATVVAGPVIDSFGTRTTFRWAALIFTVAGTAAGMAPTMPSMIVIRLVHGVGAGMLVAVALAAVGLIYPQRLIGRAFAANSTVWGVMGIAAPALAALFVTIASWRWVFWLNLPLGLIALAAGWSILPGAPEPSIHAPTERRRPDLIGTGLIALFTIGLLLAVGDLDVGSFGWLVVCGLVVGAYIIHARRSPTPVVRIEHVFRQPYSTIGATVALMLLAAVATNTYITLYVSAGRGAGTGMTAWSVFFFVIGWTIGANISSRLQDTRAETSVMVIGLVTTISGLLTVTVTTAIDSPLPLVFVGLFFGGGGIGVATNAGLTLLRTATHDSSIGRANAAHQFLRNLGFTMGAAVGGAVLLVTVANLLGTVQPVQDLLTNPTSDVDPAVAGAVATAYTVTAATGTGAALAAIIPMTMLRRHFREARTVRARSDHPGGSTRN